MNPSPLGTFPDGDPEVTVVYKVCKTSVSESAHPLVEYFQRASSWHRLKKSVAWFLWYCGNLRRLSKRGKSRESIEFTPILSLPLITVEEMEIAELEILRNVQQFHLPEELKSLSKSENGGQVKKRNCLSSEPGSHLSQRERGFTCRR